MKIYFVRHAESEGNVSAIEHRDEVSITAKGREQAQLLAKRFKQIRLDTILSSSYIRAKETAEIIAAETNCPITLSETLIERRMPSETIGKEQKHDEIQSLYDILMENFKRDNARHSDEENFEDLKERAEKALDFIKEQNEESILVVTHSNFLKMLLSYIIFGKELTGHEFVQIHRTFWNDNTGITLVTYEKSNVIRRNDWRVRSWNDLSHLG